MDRLGGSSRQMLLIILRDDNYGVIGSSTRLRTIPIFLQPRSYWRAGFQERVYSRANTDASVAAWHGKTDLFRVTFHAK